MKKLILHIPHSAKKIPLKKGFIISQEKIDNEIMKLTDWHTEDLYNSKTCESIVFEYSRIFCDPERFSDDSKEPIAKVGMGVLHEKTGETSEDDSRFTLSNFSHFHIKIRFDFNLTCYISVLTRFQYLVI